MAKNELIDELRAITFPVVLGSGKRLFGPGTVPTGFAVGSHFVTAAGVVVASCLPKGRPSCADAEPPT
jgi:hypothetical protein